MWLAALLGADAGVIDLGDIEFLRLKSLNGDLIIVVGSVTATGEIVQYTPTTGKTFFLYKAAVFLANRSGSFAQSAEAEVRNDTNNKDTIGYGGQFAAGNSGQALRNESIIQGDKLIGNSTKKYSVNCTHIANAALTLHATIIGWIENT